MKAELNQTFNGGAKPNVFELAIGFSKAATLHVEAPSPNLDLGMHRDR